MQEQQINISDGMSIDLLRLVKALLKKAWLLVAMTILFGVAGYAYSAYMITPMYRTSFTAYVNNRGVEEADRTSAADLSASKSLANLYSEIIVSRSVLLDAADDCQIPANYGRLKGMVTTSVSEYAAMITVHVTGSDPQEITMLASGIAKAAPVHVARVVDGTSMRIVDEPVMPTSKFSPSNSGNAMKGAVIGFILAAGLVILIELINDKVENAEELENRYQLPIIGSIPDIARAEKHRGKYGKQGYYKYGYKYAYDAYRKGGKGSK